MSYRLQPNIGAILLTVLQHTNLGQRRWGYVSTKAARSGVLVAGRIMKRMLSIVFLLLLVISACSRVTPPADSPQDAGEITIDLELQARIERGEAVSYLVFFRQKADLSPAYTLPWEERGRFVFNALQQTAERSQRGVRNYLRARGATFEPFWIDNVIVVKHSDEATFKGLRSFPEISIIKTSPDIRLFEPDVKEEPFVLGIQAVISNIARVKAPDAWNLGFRGEGIVVASIDTGVRFSHEALVNQYRGNQGGGTFDHNYNWWNPYATSTAPSDSHNHGSHVTGTMVGDDGDDNQIGMAPDAQWIACMGFSPDATDAGLLECAQFMVAPWDLNKQNPNPDLRPHIVNNSWGDCERSYDGWYQGVVNAWHAAGIYPVFSAGNAASCFYSAPAGLNTVGNPARYGNVTAVGSTGNNDGQYATHSNWGPTDNLDVVNPRGYPRLKPQVVAPGVGIVSSYRGNDSLYGTMTGTSMSAPHVAGMIALVWNAAPCLIGDYSNTETLIEETATPIAYTTANGDEGPNYLPNHATGWGEINALEAVQAAQLFCSASGTLSGRVTDANTATALIGAQVLIEGSGFTRTIFTRADGTYSLRLPTDSVTVTVSKSRYASRSTTVTITDDATTEANLALPAGRLAGTPSSLEAMVAPGSTSTVPFTLTNSGSAPLAFSFSSTVGFSTEHFEAAFPPAGWTVLNDGTAGTQCGWQRNDTVIPMTASSPNPRPNFAGGDGFSATADSDACGDGTTTDSELHTPTIDLSSVTRASLTFVLSYRHAGSSAFTVDISPNGGGSWTTLRRWTSTVSGQGPGEAVQLDLTPYVGSANTVLRFRYTSGWDWWVQIDRVMIDADASWLSFSPTDGVIEAGNSLNIDANLDARTVTAAGTHHAVVEVVHDTPYSISTIPVAMTVREKVTPSFSNLSSPTIIYGTASTTLTGTISGDPLPPTGAISITLNGVTQQAAIQTDGTFESTFATPSLVVSSSPYPIDYGFAGNAGFHPSTGSGTLTVDRATLAVTAEDRSMTYGAATMPTFGSNVGGLVNGDTSAVVSGWPLTQQQYSTSATTTSPAGDYAITPHVSSLSASNYQFAAVAGTLTVSRARAEVGYTGDTYLEASSSAQVRLAARVSNIDPDAPHGDLSLARLSFKVYTYGGTLQASVRNVAVTSSGDGEAHVTLPVDDSGPYEVVVGIEPNNSYWWGAEDLAALQIALTASGQRVSGGGWIADSQSVNAKGNFGFTVATQKNGRVSGNVLYLFRGTDGYNYRMKSNSWQGGGVSFNIDRDAARAAFTGRANVQKIDRTTGEVVEAWGNYRFTVDIFDGDLKNPRQADTYAITILDSTGQVWRQVGSRNNPLPLGGGNVKVQSG